VFPLWDIAIAPVIEATGATRVVEIGALRGETTVQLLDRLGPESEIHVIDPVPEFDPTEHEQRFPGRYLFYRDLSHNVLPGLPPMDVALIDGDHNWYTVFHELRMLSEVARSAGAPLPVLVMHDVLWPYGRRDLYYAPENIPEEFRHQYKQGGMNPGRPGLMPPGRGGVNPTMNNATREGGPRNGVMTAVEDFLEDYDKPVRLLVLPIYFGLAIVVEEDRLAATPALAAVLNRLESAEGRLDLLELAESLRLRALQFQHNTFYASEARLGRVAGRYLDVLKGGLLDEHHLENEVRIAYLVRCLRNQSSPGPGVLHDPNQQLRREVDQLRAARRAGTSGGIAPDTPIHPFTTVGRDRLDHLQGLLDVVRTESVEGDLVTCGADRGGIGVFLRGYLEAYELLHRQVWVADAFRDEWPERIVPGESEVEAEDEPARPQHVGLNLVRQAFARFDLLDDRVRFLQGDFAATLPGAPFEKLAALHVATDTYDDTRAVLDSLYDKVTLGGFVVVDNNHLDDCRRAIEEFRVERGIVDPIERVGWAGAFWRKTTAPQAGTRGVDSHPSPIPLAPPAPSDAVALSIIVVFYNMRREALRTLHSLSRGYQEGVDGLDYEVIVVENGSSDDERLGDELVRSFGKEFRYLDLGEEATPSPVHALNRGLKLARGEHIALMIDGAHVLSPGVLRFAMLGLKDYAPAMVAIQQWYVGPGQQPVTMLEGYDQEFEDRLFRQIDWPADGYGLFEISHFVGDRDWFDGLWESNCLFVPRAVLEQVGAFDETFSMPGGGFANLDLYERIGSTPGLTVTTVLGEGSFHQLHGGTTTNESDLEERERRLTSYREHYAELRGRAFRGHGKPIHYTGSMFDSARRTRARRRTAQAFFAAAKKAGLDGRANKPVPIHEELKVDYTDAFWRSLVWKDWTWLGRTVKRCPTDLIIVQELISQLRPQWIVEVPASDPGRASFLTSVCDLLDHGRVLSVGPNAGSVPEHDRQHRISGDPVDPTVLSEVRDLVGEPSSALLILTLASRATIVDHFERYEWLVPPGSYVIVEDTIVNGHPVWEGMGPGPFEAVREIMRRRSDFAPDPRTERFGLTFNPGGFLKRLH
jgi:cephalosporin hydroxylase/glycosyltransferase involved in cell wall biosynthesis